MSAFDHVKDKIRGRYPAEVIGQTGQIRPSARAQLLSEVLNHIRHVP